MLAVLSLFLFIAYVAYAIIQIKSVPDSISDTYYQLEKRNRPKWLFQIAMVVPAMLLLPAWLDCSNESIQCLTFLSCAGLSFVGVAPLFKLEFEGKVHYISAAICGGCAVLWLVLSGMWYFPALFFLSAIVLACKYSKLMFWAECAAFASTFIGVLFKVFT